MRETLNIKTPISSCPDGHSVNSDGSMIAIVRDESVQIVDQKGCTIHQVDIDPTLTVFTTKWNSSGNTICIVMKEYDHALLWSRSLMQTFTVEIGFKDPSLLLWSPYDDVFLLGTMNGNLIIYDVSSHHIETILGKHSGEITCGAWVGHATFLLGSLDKSATLSKLDGQTLQVYSLSECPLRISCASVQDTYHVAIDTEREILFLCWSESTVQGQESGSIISIPEEYCGITCHFWERSCESLLLATSSGSIMKVLNPFVTESHEVGLFDHKMAYPRKCLGCFEEQMFVYSTGM